MVFLARFPLSTGCVYIFNCIVQIGLELTCKTLPPQLIHAILGYSLLFFFCKHVVGIIFRVSNIFRSHLALLSMRACNCSVCASSTVYLFDSSFSYYCYACATYYTMVREQVATCLSCAFASSLCVDIWGGEV